MSAFSNLRARMRDTLENLVSRMGTERDKSFHSTYVWAPLTAEELLAAYRSAWLPRKIVDVPASDSTRMWRSWQAKDANVEDIEEEERRLNVRGKVLEARVAARLFGGAAIFIGTNQPPEMELNPSSIKKGGITYLTVFSRSQLSPSSELQMDPMLPDFNQPLYYDLSLGSMPQGQIRIHPSRLVKFYGNIVPDELGKMTALGWGDSILESAMKAIKDADGASGNLASLLFDAKMDIIKVPGFMESLASEDYKSRVMERFTLAAMAKGINGTLMLDSEEEYEQKQLTFNGTSDAVITLLQIVSGAADIPVTRLLGQSPAGLNATGESDIRNYYDRIKSDQEMIMTPAMSILDDCLIQSATGKRDESIFYVWRSLWQPTAKEKAEIGKTASETIKTINDTGLFPSEALANSAMSMLIELDIFPGLDQEVDEAGGFSFLSPEEEQEMELEKIAATAAAKLANPQPRVALPPPRRDSKTEDAAPRTLYVSRKVTNSAAIQQWARGKGFSNIPSDLHVTIAFSRTELDWMKVGESWNGELKIVAGGPRVVEPMGPNGEVVALLFSSSELRWRHEAIKRAGASWDWEDYQPHITVGEMEPGVDVRAIEAYQGEIILGPEIWEELDLTRLQPKEEQDE